MVLELGARRHVDHRRQHHQTVDPDALGVAGVGHGTRGGELRDPGNERHPPADGLDRALEHGALLLGGEGVVLPDGAEQHHAVNPVAHQRRLHGRGRCGVEREVGAELGGGRRKDSGPGALGRGAHGVFPVPPRASVRVGS